MTNLSSLIPLARRVVGAARDAGATISTAESCTGGLVAALLTEVEGASAAFDRGFVTYSNAAKTDMLGVPHDLIATDGAVSGTVAAAMAEGALARAGTRIAVAITGIAGPGGGSVDKPVGLVHFGLAMAGQPTRTSVRTFAVSGRSAIRLAAAGHALELVLNAIDLIAGSETAEV